MKKLFAMFLALTMTFQLMTPVWADGAGEEPEEVTEASEVAEEEPQEETTEPTEEEPAEETTEATEEELPKEPTEAPAEETEEPAVEEFPEEEEPILEEAPEEEFSLQSDEGTLVSGTCGENVSWVLTSDGTLTISGSGKMADYNTSSNTAPWYKNRTSVVSVVVKSGVTSLSSYAFYGCYKLASAILEAGVETVGSYAFQDCKKLTGVMLSDGLKEIGYDAFSGCSGLTDVTIPEGVTKLGSSAFYNCSSLTGVTIPEGVTSIWDYAFYGCSSLTSVRIPESVTSIRSGAFYGCSSLTSVTIPDSVTSMEWSAFSGCSSLTSVKISDGVTSIASGAFSDCSGLTSVTIPEGVTSIGSSAFSGCSSLTSVTIPEGVTSIGSSAFSGCSSLTSVTIPEGVTSIGGSAFSGCSGLTSVTIPESVTSIENGIFSGCSSLTSIMIPEGVTSIGESAFSGCSNLTSITIPEGVTSIGWDAFSGCNSLTSITLPEGVKSIGSSAFSGCSGLTSVTVPEGVTSIGYSAFSGCSSLTSVTIPESITNIEESTFYKCSSLTSVTIPDSVTSIGKSAFSSCSSLTSAMIPESVTSIEQDTFENCSSLASVSISKNVTSIGGWAFYGCLKLRDVYYGGTKAEWENISIGGYNGPLQQATIHYQAAAASQICPLAIDSLESGKTLKLTLWSPMQNKQLSAKWSLAKGNETYATIDPDGTLTAKAVTAPVQITVKAEPVTGEDGAEKTLWILPSTAGLDIVASGACGKNVNWVLTSDGTLTISGRGEMDNYGDYFDSQTAPWYDYRENIQNVLVKSGVTNIGHRAFFGCGELISATLLGGVQTVGNSAFQDCKKLTSVGLPDGLKDIYSWAFYGCSSLKSVNIPKGVTNVAYEAFKGCSGLTSVTIPEGVIEIQDGAFYGCSSLTNVTLPEGLKYINRYSFSGCSSLTSVKLPDSLTSIWYGAFSDCSSLASVTLPNGVTKIDGEAFENCNSLTGIEIPNSVTSIEDAVFSGCSSLASVVIPTSVTSIGADAFSGCSSLTKLTIPNSVTSIGNSAFEGCSSLTSVTIPNSVTSIGSSAFFRCSSLTSIVIPNGVTSIGVSTFSGCSSLSSITIPEGVTSIEGSAFRGCSSLSSITIPESVTSIGERAFQDCSSLSSITIPDGVTSIESGAFYNCSSLTSVTIPEGVTSIEQNTFYRCSSLTSVTIPASVTSIGDGAFCPCFNLKDVYYGGTKADWDKISFGEDDEFLLRATLHYKGQSTPEIRPVDASTLDGGATLKLTLWSIDQNKQIGAAWSLAEGSEAYASITASGTLTAKAVIQPVEITVIAQPTNGEPTATKTIRITPKATALLLMRDGETLGETLNADMYDLQALTLTAIKNTMEEAQGIHWSTSAKTVAQVDAKGLVTLLKPGTAVIQATDSGKLTGKVTLNVTYTDKSPRLEATTLNLNTALSGGVTVDFVEAYGNGVEALQWNDARFLFEYQENRLTVSAKDTLKNGTYPVSLTAACADGRTYEYPLTLKVTNTLPKVTVKQTAKLNLFYRDSRAPLVISAPGQRIENAELTDTGDFALENTEDGWEIVCTTDSPKPDTKGTLNLYLEGYREPVKAALNIGTVSTAPKAKLSATSSTVNSGSDLTTQVKLLDNSGKPLELEDPTVVCENASVSVDGNLLTITLDEAKSTTVTLYLQDSTWARSMKLTHKITVSNKTPTLKPAGSLTLSSLFTARTAETAMVLSQSNLTLVDVEAAPTAKAGTSALAESEKLRVAYDPDTGHMVAAIRDPGNAPKAGTYSFACTGTLEDGKDIPGGTLRVTVSAAAPKIKLSATSVKLNQYLAGEEQGRVRVTAPSGYQVADFTGKPEGMSFDEDTGMLTVTLEDASHRGGTYTLYPLVRDVETGEEVTLPTKLNFQVRAYNSKKLSVSLSAKGKLDTQRDGEIAYTVTKLTNCLGTLENVELVGQDGDLFQADMDLVNGRPTVHLTLVSGSTYATNKAYKIQLRFYACGKEILSPVQTVKVTQTALKVTAPKTVTYYQAQKAPLRVALTTNLPMDTVALNSKTAKEFQSALGEVTLNGNRVEFEIANPAALTAGKSYSVILDATPENNAKNIKPVTVKLTVKVRK